MLDRETITLVAALSERANRIQAAAEVAAHFEAESLVLLVEDIEVDALLPAPGTPQAVAGGPAWRAFLRQCRAPGIHSGTVAYPTADTSSSAVACAGSGIALVFIGGSTDLSRLEPLSMLLPLLGAAIRAQHAQEAASGEILVAREEARHAGALARSLDEARADLERQTKSLADAQTRAESAARTKDEFLAMLGHELRNPMGPITTALQIMRFKGSNSREQDILERQVGNLLRLIDDLLDVSRIASGKVELRIERIELAVAVARAVELASPLLERKQQVLSVDVPDRGLAVDGDPERLAQVFSNLLNNAAKYSDAGTRIVVSAERRANRVDVRVKDDGYGIAPSMLETIFDQFTQQQQSIERSLGGLGLGLAIVKNLVSLHGGSVRAVSAGRGNGSEFIVDLPISSVPDSLASAANPTNGVLVKRPLGILHRILVVDDNADAANLLSEALAGLGYVVRTAPDGPAALRMAEEFRPQIALLDIGLPVMDGYELGRRLRDAQGETELLLVAVTGYGQASDKARSQEAGFDAHLVKPLDLRDLQRLLDRFHPAAPSATAD